MSFNIHDLPDSPEDLELFINRYEAGIKGVKANARATVVWADPNHKSKTEYVLIYLHGFKASYGEGEPIHRAIAHKFGLNLYLSRLYKHGLDDPDAFSTIEAQHFTESARQAFYIGQKLGKKIIIMGTSTGGSLGLYLAGHPSFRHSIAGLILYSPLIRFYGLKHMLLATKPGRTLLRLTPGGSYMLTSPSASEAEEDIWYSSYRLQGALALGKFVQEKMTKATFSNVQCPVFAGYYYKNREQQDKVVSVPAIKKMFEQLGTEKNKKCLLNFPDAQTHIISSQLYSASLSKIERQTTLFIQSILGLKLL